MKLTGHKSPEIHRGYTHLEMETLKEALLKLPCLSDVKQQLSTSKFDFEVGEAVNWQRYDSSRCRTSAKIFGEAIPGDCFDWSPPKR